MFYTPSFEVGLIGAIVFGLFVIVAIVYIIATKDKNDRW